MDPSGKMEKRFRTRKQWHNTSLVLWTLPFLILFGAFLLLSTGLLWPLVVMVSGGLFAFVRSYHRDRSVKCTYVISDDVLVLTSGKDRMEIRAEEINDASLVDRTGARNYILQRSARSGVDAKERRTMQRAYQRFCTVDIGLRSFTFGVGRGMIDRMPNARHDIVLLRLRNGHDLLLSPEYNQDMVDQIMRMLRKREESERS